MSVYRTIGPLVYQIFFILAGNQDIIISQTRMNFSQIRPRTAELAALERLKNFHRLIMGKILLALYQAPSFLIGSSSFLQVTRTATTIKAWKSSNLGRIPLLTSELVALECLKKRHIILLAL